MLCLILSRDPENTKAKKRIDFLHVYGIIIARTSYMSPRAFEWGSLKINKEKLNDLR